MQGISRSGGTGALVLAALLLTSSLAWGQANTKTQSAEITAESMTFNWATNEMVFSGGARAVISGANPTTLAAPKFTVRLSEQQDRVLSLVAAGPVHIEIVGKPDAQGVRARITAAAKDRAEYAEATQKIVLYGGAEADYVSLPEGPDSRRAHFTGEIMEADLNTSILTVTKARLNVTAPLPPPEGATPPQ